MEHKAISSKKEYIYYLLPNKIMKITEIIEREFPKDNFLYS